MEIGKVESGLKAGASSEMGQVKCRGWVSRWMKGKVVDGGGTRYLWGARSHVVIQQRLGGPCGGMLAALPVWWLGEGGE